MLGALLAFLGLVQMLAVAIVPVGAVEVPSGTVAGFEAEGNQSDDAGSGIDWENVNGVPSGEAQAVVATDSAPIDGGFQGTSKENDPTQFSCQRDVGDDPGKDDLLRGYIYPDITLDEGLLALGFVRRTTEGNTHVNFEFNQGPITFTPNPDVPGPTPCPYLGRKANDVLFTFEFPGNGTAELFIYTWVTDPNVENEGHWAELVLEDELGNPIIPNFAAGADNAGAITDVFTGDSLIARAFGEVAIDLIELEGRFGEGTFLRCPGFGVASIRSRSSGESFDSALQDFIAPTPVDLSTCGSIEINKVDDQGNPLEGVRFTLHSSLDAETVIDECWTDSAGDCLFEDVPPTDTDASETYFVNEDATTVPEGYTAAQNPVKSGITVGFKENVDLTGSPIENPRQTGNARIVKQFAELDPEGGADIVVDVPDTAYEGLTFQLYNDLGGDAGAYDDGIDEIVQLHPSGGDAECTIGTGETSCDIGPVATGTYSVHEVDPPDEASPQSPDPTVTITVDHTAEVPTEVTFTNYLSPLDIDLDKSGPDTAVVGETFTYTFDVTLNPEVDIPLKNIELIELNTERCNVESAPLEGPEITGEAGDIDWLEPGETWTYTCDHLVTFEDPDPLPNKARVTGEDRYDRQVLAEDEHEVDILYPDVAVAKVAVDDSITAGDEIAFDITVSNIGDGTAFDVTLEDTLPAGIDWQVDDETNCSIASGVLDCDFGDIGPDDEPITVRVSGTTDTGECGTVENTATIGAANEGDDVLDNNESTDDVDVSCPDVQLEKDGNGPISAGDTAIWTITVTNNSQTTAATGVEVEDLQLPAGIDWQTGTTGCAIAGSELTCELGTIAAGDEVEIIVTGETDAGDCAVLDNEATVTATNEDPLLSDNNTDDAEITVQCPDIYIDKSPDDGVVNATDDVSFTIVFGNNGPGIAYDVVVEDELPGDIDWTDDSDDCSIDGDDVLTCSYDSLAAGEEITVTVSGSTDPEDCGTLPNLATVDASNDGQESDEGEITVQCPDIDINKVADDDVVSAGTNIGFTITVTNAGPGTAYDLVVSDTLPAGPDWSIDPAVEGCAIASGMLTCTVDEFSPEDELVVHIGAPTDETLCGAYDNLAAADASNDDEVTDEDSVAVLCPGLNILKSADALVVDSPGEVGFTITVSNVDDGEDPPEGTATDVTVTDEMPVGLEWSLDPAVDGCAITDGVLDCELGDLEPGDSVDIHVVAQADVADCGTIDNEAVADASNGPAIDDDATIDVLCPLDIEIEKDGPDLAHVGDEIAYSFDVTNTGDADLVTVVVTDPLCDSEITLVDDADGDTVLSVDETWSYTCTHVITEDDPDPLPNTATAVGTDERDRTTDDEDDHVVDIIDPAIQIVKTVDNDAPNPGDTITFSYEVTNTGDTTLFDVVVIDDQLGEIGTIDELAPGDSVTLDADDEVQADQSLVNVGTATGSDVLGLEVSDDDDAVISIVLPDVISGVVTRAPLPFTGGNIGVLLFAGGLSLILGGALTTGARLRFRRTP